MAACLTSSTKKSNSRFILKPFNPHSPCVLCRSFVHRGSDASGSTSSTFRFSADGSSGVLETSGVVYGSAYTGRNEFDVVSVSSTSMVIRYTSASDRDLAPYIVGKKESLTLNASNRSITYNGDVHK